MAKRITIVGGGYIGVILAKFLEDKADISLVEDRSHFVHAPAMIRAVVQPEILESALIPYDSLLRTGRIISERASRIHQDAVELSGGNLVDSDLVVVATGSSNAVPFKPPGSDIEQLRADNARIHGLLQAANTVAIVGAGAVGTELAGEIAHAMPDKNVTLIANTPRLFPDTPAKLGDGLARKLGAAGVDVRFGVTAVNLESKTSPYAGKLELSDGSAISADLIFPVIGSRATSELLESLPGGAMGAAGRVKVDPWLRPSSYPNVLAAGDVADAGDAMTIVAAIRQAAWLKRTSLAWLRGKTIDEQKPYVPWKNPPLLIPLGPDIGSSFLSFFVAGDFLTSRMKGRDLFLPRYNKLLGRS